MPKRTQRDTTIAARRKQVASLYLRGATQQQIAAQLGIAQGTVSKDVKAILADWRSERLQDADDYVARQLEELATVRREAWTGFQRAGGDESGKAWLELVIKAQDREAKLLGLNAPTRTDVTSGNEAVKLYVGISPDDWETSVGG